MLASKRIIGTIITLSLLFALCAAAQASAPPVLVDTKLSDPIDAALFDTAGYVYDTVKNPQVDSTGGEWAVFGLARSGYDVPDEYYHRYYATLEAYVIACAGTLHSRKYSEYSRVILAITAIGKDPRNVAGYDLLRPLGDYDKTVWQGLSGPIFALIALDSGDYPMPINDDAEIQATREMYVNAIIERQLPGGGFNLTGSGATDPNITGMALQALSKYQERDDVRDATNAALDNLSRIQLDNGGFMSWGEENSENNVQVIVALTELGISMDDPRFVKSGNSLIDYLLTYYIPGEGFLHAKTVDRTNLMATEQALYALVAIQRLRDGLPSLYTMVGDKLDIGEMDVAMTGPKPGEGLERKHGDVRSMPIVLPGITYDDISGENSHTNAPAIHALAARGIISGKTDSEFAPDDPMTRAELAAVVVIALGLYDNQEHISVSREAMVSPGPGPVSSDLAANTALSEFTDVASGSRYYGGICTAYAYGIVNGVGNNMFNPEATVTREEAAVIIARAARLCGLDLEMSTGAIRDELSPFLDYVTISSWARESVAICYSYGILAIDGDDILPKEPILRCEAAQMIFNLLGKANLL